MILAEHGGLAGWLARQDGLAYRTLQYIKSKESRIVDRRHMLLDRTGARRVRDCQSAYRSTAGGG